VESRLAGLLTRLVPKIAAERSHAA
jgi:hypothetical protein